MDWAYDLHLHTAASPCGSSLMTPNNIVNMSLLKGLDVIAITDHQTVANCEAVINVGRKKGLYVVPGMEIECMEEFHLIALFKEMTSAYKMEQWLWQYLPEISNRKDIFGSQIIFDEEDESIGEIERFLLTAARVSAYEIIQQVRKLNGFVYPAHIDRMSYSILSNLGSIPTEYQLTYLEISRQADIKRYEKQYTSYHILQSSDAHYLEDIAERVAFLTEDEREIMGVFS